MGELPRPTVSGSGYTAGNQGGGGRGRGEGRDEGKEGRERQKKYPIYTLMYDLIPLPLFIPPLLIPPLLTPPPPYSPLLTPYSPLFTPYSPPIHTPLPPIHSPILPPIHPLLNPYSPPPYSLPHRFRSCICALILEGWLRSYGCGKLGL